MRACVEIPPSLVAAILCLVPAMTAVYLFLRRYEGYFDERRLFFALFAGLFAGLLVAWLELVLFRIDDARFVAVAGLPFTLTYFCVGYAIVESLAKGGILGLKRFRLRKDTPYYGVALGLSFAAIVAMQNLAIELRAGDVLHLPPVQMLSTLIVLCLLWIGYLVAHAASAVWMGRGVGNGKLWVGVATGALLLLPVQFLRYFAVRLPDETATDLAVSLVGAFLVLIYGVGLAYLTDKRVLETIVPPEIREQVRRARRREIRKGEA